MGLDHAAMPRAPVIEAFGALTPGQEALDVDGDFVSGRHLGERNQVIHHSLRTSQARLGRIRADFISGDTPGDADELLDEIAQQLVAIRDPKNGAQVVLRADKASDVYSGERVAEGPDLIVCYDVHYGGSDASTLGEITEAVLEDNRSRWSGNHLMAPEVVPGILLVNRKLEGSGHDLTDVTATLLDHYGLPPSEGMVGRSIFAN